MKDHDSITWIGGEGDPYRDHTGQREERAEAAISGFQTKEARGKHSTVHKCPYGFFVHVHSSQWRRLCMYVG